MAKIWTWVKAHWKGLLFAAITLLLGILGVARLARKQRVEGVGDNFLVDEDTHFIWLQGPKKAERFEVPDGKTAKDIRAVKYVAPGVAHVEMSNVSIDDI